LFYSENSSGYLTIYDRQMFFQQNQSSVVVSRNLQEVTWNKIFVAFKANLFTQNQLKIASKDEFALLNRIAESASERNTVMSSAKDKIFSVVLFEIPFIYKCICTGDAQ